MSSRHHLAYFVLLFSSVIHWSISLQLNLHLTQWEHNNAVLQHNCLFVNHWENEEENIYEITSYCLSEWPSEWNIRQNALDQRFSFAELFARNITSDDLYRWSAPLDIVENYEMFIFNDTSRSDMEFINCTGEWFGPKCQYSFDLDNSSSFSSLDNIIDEFYLTDRDKQLGPTCYVHLQCDLGFSSLCIQWSDVCDGFIRCINGTDEANCWQLEINECNENEFRCRNGQCIPWSFHDEKSKSFDCLDGSDEFTDTATYVLKSIAGPVYKLEELFCGKSHSKDSKNRFSCLYECFDYGRTAPNAWLFFVDESKLFSSECWSALSCYLKLIKLSNDSNCINICQGNSCKEIIAKECPDMFFMPNAPIAFGHIYLAYTKAYLINQTTPSSLPEYICYNEELCGGFDPNKIFISFKNTICRRPQDFSATYYERLDDSNSLCYYISWMWNNLQKCNTSPLTNSIPCDTSTMYQCMNSSKCIAQTRLQDAKLDCDYQDDEISVLGHRDCPIKSSQFYFNCTTSNKCVSRKVFADGSCDCFSLAHPSCEDELFPATHPALHISFPHICNRMHQFKLISHDGNEETDESDCEQWPCHTLYTHCNGIFDCPDGIDELDCHPPSLINCSSRSFVCFSDQTSDYTCLSPEKINDGNIDCIGAVDESELCDQLSTTDYKWRYLCKSAIGSHCSSHSMLCDKRPRCLNGSDENFCRHLENPDLFKTNGICDNDDAFIRSDTEEFLCNLFKDFYGTKTIHFSLGRTQQIESSVIKHEVQMTSTLSSSNPGISLDQDHCHRHPRLRVRLNEDHNGTRMACLCPSGRYGHRCQYQNQRVSLSIQFRAFSDSWQTPFTIILSLMDDSDKRTIHSHEQLTYVPVPNCKTKYNIELLYATRMKNESRLYFVHLDIYEKRTSAYRGSLRLPLPFLFLPVQRVAAQLNIPYTNYNFYNCSNSSCAGHGRCARYFDDPIDDWFCQCEEKWSGRYCHIPHHCSCASSSTCLGQLTNNRSICVCPIDRWGPRCLLHDRICRSDLCKNGGQCIPIHSYAASDRQFVCICRKGYSGNECEVTPNTITLSFETDLALPESMLIHLIEAKTNAPPENGTIFKTIPIDRSPAIINIPRSFHIAFAEFFPRKYYLIVVKDVNDRSKSIEKTLRASNQCLNITQILNETVLQLHLLHRIKLYHRSCQEYSPQLACFYDIGFLCLCTDFFDQRQANCFEFDHQLKRDCRGQSNCKNDAACLQDDVNCPASSICVCPRCFYGSLCQFSSSGFGPSLDAILGSHIQPEVSIRHQPIIVQVSLILTVLIIVMGLLDGVLSLITFVNIEPRKVGCGLYLMGSSITTLLISVIFAMKFSILLVAQITYMTNRSFLLFQCRSLDFILRTGLFMDQWLNACVAMERAITAIQGCNFDKNKSKTVTKFLIPTFLVFTAATNIPEILFRHLLEDDSNDEKRIWCIVKYPSAVQLYNSIMNIIHFCVPFILNLFSALVIIIITARLRRAAKHQSEYGRILREQLQQHKHLLIAPVILVILGIPRLVISFLPGCMQSSADAWLFLMGYFISFIPPILPFFIFVIPSKAYKEEFYKSIRRYQQAIRTWLRLSQ